MNAATHPDYLALLRGVLDAPEDDAVRLVLADFLEENGQVERSSFIRVQCRLAAWPCECDSEERVYYDECRCGEKFALQRRERELLNAHRREWLTGLPQRWEPAERFLPRPCPYTFRRGFVERIELTAADFLRHAGAIFSAQPVEAATLADKRSAWVDYPEAPEARWWREGDGADHTGCSWCLPAPIFDLLPGEPHARDGGLAKAYTGEDCILANDAALAALSVACVSLGRTRAGLPPLARA